MASRWWSSRKELIYCFTQFMSLALASWNKTQNDYYSSFLSVNRGPTVQTFSDIYWSVNLLMVVTGINACVFETKPCLRGLIFAVSSGLVDYLGTHALCLRVFIFAIYRWSWISPNKSLANITEFTVFAYPLIMFTIAWFKTMLACHIISNMLRLICIVFNMWTASASSHCEIIAV